MSLLQCDWAASPCSGREQQGTVTGGPSSVGPRLQTPTSPSHEGSGPVLSSGSASSPLVLLVWHQVTAAEAQPHARAGEAVRSVPGLF